MTTSACSIGKALSPDHRLAHISRKTGVQAQVKRTTGRSGRRSGTVRAVAKRSDASSSDRVFLTLDLGQAAFREPVAFWGGVFAGFLGLNLDQDPLKEWLQQTVANIEELNPQSTAIVPVKERNFETKNSG